MAVGGRFYVRSGFVHNNGLVIFDGSGLQSLGGGGVTFHDITVSSGVTLTARNMYVTIEGSVTRESDSATLEITDVDGPGAYIFPLADTQVDVTALGSLSSLEVVRQENVALRARLAWFEEQHAILERDPSDWHM